MTSVPLHSQTDLACVEYLDALVGIQAQGAMGIEPEMDAAHHIRSPAELYPLPAVEVIALPVGEEGGQTSLA